MTPNKTIDYYNENAESFYQRTVGLDLIEIYEKFLEQVPDRCTILDAGCGSGLTGIELKKRGYANIHGVDFSKSMLNLIPNNIYQTVELIDLNEPLKYNDNDFDVIICVGTFTYGHVKAHALDEFIRVTNKNGYICFTINEGIYTEYKFDKKINELSKNKSWEILNLSKSSYIVNKDVKAWLCLAKKN